MVLISQGSKSKVPEKRAPAKKHEQKGLKKVQTSTAEQEQTPGFGGARFKVLKDSSLKFNQHDHIAPLNSRKNVHASLTKVLCSVHQGKGQSLIKVPDCSPAQGPKPLVNTGRLKSGGFCLLK